MNGNTAAITFDDFVGVVAILAQADAANLWNSPEARYNVRIYLAGLSVAKGKKVVQRKTLTFARSSLKNRHMNFKHFLATRLADKLSHYLSRFLVASVVFVFIIRIVLSFLAGFILVVRPRR